MFHYPSVGARAASASVVEEQSNLLLASSLKRAVGEGRMRPHEWTLIKWRKRWMLNEAEHIQLSLKSTTTEKGRFFLTTLFLDKVKKKKNIFKRSILIELNGLALQTAWIALYPSDQSN